jgi:hypothetical protein
VFAYVMCCSVTSLTVLLTCVCVLVGGSFWWYARIRVVVLGTYIRHGGVRWTRRLVHGAKGSGGLVGCRGWCV